MPPSEAEGRYTAVAIALHWTIAVLALAELAWGWWMQGIPKQPAGPRVDAFNLHKSIGLVILALMAVRIAWRIGHRPPPLPPLPTWQAAAARATHALLYVALVVQPLAGYLGSAWSGYPVKFFGLTLPAWAAKDAALKDLMSGVHLATGWLIVALVAVHVAGALRHALGDRPGFLARMGVGRR